MANGIEKFLKKKLHTDNLYIRILLAEFLGTTILMTFGCGSVAQAILSGMSGSPAGSPVTWYIAWGLGVTFGVYISGGVSGGHINPAVTLAMCILGRTKWSHLIVYFVGQYLGAFTGAALVYGMYIDAFNNFDPDRTLDTAGIFATYPQDYLTIGNALLDQIYSTTLLVLLVMAITDEKNMGPSKGLVPIAVGLVVMAIGMTFGYNCGYAINPARDLGPRFFTFIAGWPDEVFEYNDGKYFWIPIVGPHVGAVIGAVLYILFIEAHFDTQISDDKSDTSLASTKRRIQRNTYDEEGDNDYALTRVNRSHQRNSRNKDFNNEARTPQPVMSTSGTPAPFESVMDSNNPYIYNNENDPNVRNSQRHSGLTNPVRASYGYQNDGYY